MKRVLGIFVLISAFALSACGAAQTGIEVKDPWARSGFQASNSAIYFTIINHTDAADELLSASSDIADAVELHKSMLGDNGAMMMIQQDSVPLESDTEVMFAPGGLHIMLIGLRQDLKVGDTFDVTLHFKNYEDMTISVTVLDPTGATNMDNMNMGRLTTHNP